MAKRVYALHQNSRLVGISLAVLWFCVVAVGCVRALPQIIAVAPAADKVTKSGHCCIATLIQRVRRISCLQQAILAALLVRTHRTSSESVSYSVYIMTDIFQRRVCVAHMNLQKDCFRRWSAL